MTEPLVITSLTNARVKAIRALDMRKERKETGLFVAEGASVLMTASEQGVWPVTIVALNGADVAPPVAAYLKKAAAKGTEILAVSTAVLEKLSHKDNPQTLLGVFCQRWAEPPKRPEKSETWLALEEIRDPGNLGTIIRTADATGVSGIILVGTTCDPWSRECVRATMGSIFAVPVLRMDHDGFRALLKDWPGDTVGTHLAGREDFRRHVYRAPALVVMGGEGPGLTEETARACRSLVRIPMAGRLDSLNLAVATALVLYQAQSARLPEIR
ncbi:MAG TPA: RNA methyltransferase [Hyphomicrobiaceae bacterium]|nr:RNA methyltransferase [Hyphomicrobiaceae bacterium]